MFKKKKRKKDLTNPSTDSTTALFSLFLQPGPKQKPPLAVSVAQAGLDAVIVQKAFITTFVKSKIKFPVYVWSLNQLDMVRKTKRSILCACSIRTAKVHTLQQSALFWKSGTKSIAKGNVVY